MIRIAVIIPTPYAHLELVRTALGSVAEAASRARNAVDVSCVLWVNDVPADADFGVLERSIRKRSGNVKSCLFSSVNAGFSGPVNSTIIHTRFASDPDWYCVLNDDAQLCPDFFSVLIPSLKAGLDGVSCRIVKPDGSTDSTGLDYYRTGLAFPRMKKAPVNTTPLLCGTCMCISRKGVACLLDADGYVLNPLYFAYAEDLEMSLRLRDAGCDTYVSNLPLVTHLGSQTAKRASRRQLYYGYRNTLYVILLRWPILTIIANAPWLVLGQLYVFAVCCAKGYFFLYPRILASVIRAAPQLAYLRSRHRKFQPIRFTAFSDR